MKAKRLDARVATMMNSPAKRLFAGRESVRWPGERRWFALSILYAPFTIGFVGLLLQHALAGTSLTLAVIVAMMFVTLARGRLLGTSILVHEHQLPRVFALVERCAKSLGVPVPTIFVREDRDVPVAAIGMRQPFSLVISTVWLPHLKDDELLFLVAREFGHIYAGHTRFRSLFSVSGNENPVIALVFGAWLRRSAYTADRVGLLICGRLEAALQAIFVTSFQPVSEQIDTHAFSQQREQLKEDASLQYGELMLQTPYATHRVGELQRFAVSKLYEFWRSEIPSFLQLDLPAPKAQTRLSFGTVLFAAILDVVTFVSVAGYLIQLHAVKVVVSDSAANSLEALSNVGLAGLIGIIFVIVVGRTPGMLIIGIRGWRRPAR